MIGYHVRDFSQRECGKGVAATLQRRADRWRMDELAQLEDYGGIGNVLEADFGTPTSDCAPALGPEPLRDRNSYKNNTARTPEFQTWAVRWRRITSSSNAPPPHAPLASGNDGDFDVLAKGEVVGRIFKVNAAPVGSPWMWTLAFGYHRDRAPNHGYTATREAAMAAFAKSWRRE
jgi:hypothetical protein